MYISCTSNISMPKEESHSLKNPWTKRAVDKVFYLLKEIHEKEIKKIIYTSHVQLKAKDEVGNEEEKIYYEDIWYFTIQVSLSTKEFEHLEIEAKSYNEDDVYEALANRYAARVVQNIQDKKFDLKDTLYEKIKKDEEDETKPLQEYVKSQLKQNFKKIEEEDLEDDFILQYAGQGEGPVEEPYD